MAGRANNMMSNGSGARSADGPPKHGGNGSGGSREAKFDHIEGPTLSLDDIDLRRLGDLFRLLGDGTRLSILRTLSSGEVNVGTLCDILKLPQPTVSHHLSLLRVSGLIDNRRAGKQVFYRLNGRVSPAALPADKLLEATKAGDAIGHDAEGHLDIGGIQIVGHGFAVQILAGDHAPAGDASNKH